LALNIIIPEGRHQVSSTSSRQHRQHTAGGTCRISHSVTGSRAVVASRDHAFKVWHDARRSLLKAVCWGPAASGMKPSRLNLAARQCRTVGIMLNNWWQCLHPASKGCCCQPNCAEHTHLSVPSVLP
jgi:hypothetical protein